MRRRIVLSGLGLAAFYWMIETVADSVFGGEGPIVTRLLPADANEIWMRLIIVGLILAFTSYATTTVERRARTDRKLRLLESAVEHTDDAVLITTAELDPPGPEIIYVNEAFCRQTGHAAEELLGHTPRMLQGPDSERAVLDRLRRCLELGQHFVGSITNYRKDGSSLRVELRISPVYSPAGKLTHWISVQHDVSERERTEAALRESEERYRLTVEGAKDHAIFMVSTDGRVASWNVGAEYVFGYSEEEIVGESGSRLFTPEDRRSGAYEEELRQAETAGRAEDERWHVRKDGSRFWGSGFVRPVRDGGGELCGFSQVVRDATERKRAEQALRHAEEEYRSIFENAVDGIFHTSIEGRIETANPASARILGYGSTEELMAEVSNVSRQLYVSPADRSRFENSLREQGVVRDFEARVYRKDGSAIWVSANARCIRSRDGRVVGYEGMFEDITERKTSEEALRESEERYRAVVEQAADGLYLADMQTLRIVGTNPSIRKMLGYSVEELHAMEAHELVGLSREEVASSLQGALEGGQGLLGERKYRRKDGTFIDVEVSASGITYGGRQTACVVIHDVTERKRGERALGEVREAERRQIARDLHDGVLQDLMDALYSMQVTRLKLVGDEGIDLSEIEEQILDLRKATQGLREAITNLRRGGVQSQPFLHLLRSVVAATRQKAPGTEVALDVDASLASVNSAAPAGNSGIELLRIVQEALVNARRHSGARHIWVSLWVEERYIIAEVVDDGRGFDAETAWAGVGLSSMQERTLKLGGSLNIQSEPGKGARVTVRIPDAASNFAADALHPPRISGAADGG